MVVRFREEYAFDISLITRSRTLSAKIGVEIGEDSVSGNSSCLIKNEKFD